PPADEVPEEPAPEQASWGALAVAGLGQDVEGNSRRFEQYYTPPKGGYPSLIQIEGVTRGGNVLSVIELQDITEPGKSAYVGLRDMKSLVDLDIGWRHDEFFEYFGSGAGQMQRDDFDVDLTIPVAREFDLDVNTGYLALNGDSNLAAVDWRAFDVGAGAYWLGDTVAVDAQFNAEDFRQLGPNSEVSGMDRVVTLAVSPARNHRHMLEAQGVLQNAQLDGFGPELERQAVGLTLSSRLATDLTFYGKLTTEETDETITQNAFAVSRDVGRASLLYSGLNKTRLEAGAEFSETEYVERFQTVIDKPQTTTFWAKARYRPCRDVRLSGSFVSRDIDETPLRSLPQGRQGPIVTYDEYERINAKGTYNISKRVGIAGQWRRDEYRLTPEGVETGLDTTSVTAWLIPCDKLTVTGSFLNLEWDISGVDGAGQTAADWVSKLNAYTVGAAYQITDDTWFDGAFTHAYSYGAVMTRDNTVTASWRKRWSDTTDVGLTFTFQDFNEAIPGNANDFEATLIGGSVIHSF
ncbi:MAG: hypothetical protein ACE5JM_03690, partial [Armatimonadota bacterium]